MTRVLNTDHHHHSCDLRGRLVSRRPSAAFDELNSSADVAKNSASLGFGRGYKDWQLERGRKHLTSLQRRVSCLHVRFNTPFLSLIPQVSSATLSRGRAFELAHPPSIDYLALKLAIFIPPTRQHVDFGDCKRKRVCNHLPASVALRYHARARGFPCGRGHYRLRWPCTLLRAEALPAA